MANSLLASVRDLLATPLPILGDEEYQRRVWFREGPEMITYSETVDCFFTYCESIFETPHAENGLGSENYGLLNTLYEQLMEYVQAAWDRLGDADAVQEEELMADPKWREIQALSAKLFRKLDEWVKRQEGSLDSPL